MFSNGYFSASGEPARGYDVSQGLRFRSGTGRGACIVMSGSVFGIYIAQLGAAKKWRRCDAAWRKPEKNQVIDVWGIHALYIHTP